MSVLLHENFLITAEKFSDKICAQLNTPTGPVRLSYAEVSRQAQKIGGWLAGQGICRGDRVGLIMENRPEWIVCYLGILLAGATAVPLDAQLGLKDADYILRDSGVRKIFVSGDLTHFKEISESFGGNIIVVGSGAPQGGLARYEEVLAGPEPAFRPPSVDADDPASIIYTSGTTGFPKGVLLSHGNFYANYQSILKTGLIGSDDGVLAILPLHHTYAFMCALVAPLLSGATVTFIDTLKSQRILECLSRERITVMPVVPQVLQRFEQAMTDRLIARPFYQRLSIGALCGVCGFLRGLAGLNIGRVLFGQAHRRFGGRFRFFVCGGAKLPESTARFFFRFGFNVLEGYGLTETAPVVSFNLPGHNRIGSVGRSLEGVRVRINDPDSKGLGQILVRGANVMKGYFHRPEETALVLRDGWLYTGDLGFTDRQGYLYIRGRLKEIIVLSSGKNISPEEVEAHYSASEIKEIAVLADRDQEKLTAIVVPNEEHFRKTGETDMRGAVKWRLEFLSEKMPSYQRIRGFVLAPGEGLPRTRLGKIRRSELPEMARRLSQKQEAPVSDGPCGDFQCGEAIFRILKKSAKVKTVTLSDHLELDLGLDSLGRLEVLAALESVFGVRMEEAEFSKIFTVRELAEKIEASGAKIREEDGPDEIPWQSILQCGPSEVLKKKIGFSGGRLARAIVFLSDVILGIPVRLYFRLRVLGAEELPQGPLILCPNHTSYLDGPIVHLAVPGRKRRDLYFVGTGGFFDHPAARPWLRFSRVIALDRRANVVESLRASAYVLSENKLLCLFPEGGRSVTGEFREPKKGIGILAKELGIKIIPVYIHGAYEAWKPSAAWPSPLPVTVIFGKPCSWEELEKSGIACGRPPGYGAVSRGAQEAIRRLKAAGISRGQD